MRGKAAPDDATQFDCRSHEAVVDLLLPNGRGLISMSGQDLVDYSRWSIIDQSLFAAVALIDELRVIQSE